MHTEFKLDTDVTNKLCSCDSTYVNVLGLRMGNNGVFSVDWKGWNAHFDQLYLLWELSE